MKIALICGSPKKKQSASGALLTDLQGFLHEAVEIFLHKDSVPEESLEMLRQADVWVIACPLYVDGIPSHLLSCLMQLEQMEKPGLLVYGIVNCGFYEGVQAKTALQILENWCHKANFVWGGGIGVGGGGGFSRMPDPPKAPVKQVLSKLAEKISRREVQENVYVSIAFPRLLYKLAAQTGWRQMIKANGGQAKDLNNRPIEENPK